MSAEDRHYAKAAYTYAASIAKRVDLGVSVGPFLLHGGTYPRYR